MNTTQQIYLTAGHVIVLTLTYVKYICYACIND